MQTATDQVPTYPTIITKSELRAALRCTSNDQWTNKVFPEEVIKQVLDIDMQTFKRIRQFNVLQTRRICIFFHLTATDFNR